MPKTPRPPGGIPGPETDWFLYLRQQFEKLHREHALILSKLGGGMISPELETALLKSATLAKKIDEKVPDKTVPPGPTDPPWTGIGSEKWPH